jgi:hypothetical protein
VCRVHRHDLPSPLRRPAHPDAIAELRRGAGTQFDPTVVDALANLVIGLEWPPRGSGANANLDNADRVGDRA